MRHSKAIVEFFGLCESRMCVQKKAGVTTVISQDNHFKVATGLIIQEKKDTERLSNDPKNLLWQRAYLKLKLTKPSKVVVCATKTQWAFTLVLDERLDT